MKKLICLFISILIIFPATGIVTKNELKNDFIGSFEREAYIKAGDDFYIHFNESNGLSFKLPSFNLSEKEKKAAARAPSWIQLRLAKQFEDIGNGDKYADLLLNAPKNYVDEIAFSIATCPSNAIPEPELLLDNVHFLYENDKYIDYANIIDFDNGSSTLEYYTLQNGSVKHVICPMSIYYWYVVHPRITFENASYIYGKFWREYLFYHNDIGYPLLKEKLNGIKYLWDGKSYHPPSKRTWKWSMKNHPTAIEAINYWVGKTVNQLAIGDRPGQPNVIAHEHNGFCGELQQISVAAQRAALIPSVGINDLGEDHVWREFWTDGWHECDNWWADGGGSVANYHEYRYGWHKIISSLFGWNGDSSIYDVTPKYIKEGDRAKVVVSIKDAMGKPVDGVRVIVVGSWKANNFKNKLWDKYVAKIWSILPDKIKEKWEDEYEKARTFYRERVPGLIPWIFPSTWNFTGVDGKCSFNLGLGHSYLFIITKDETSYIGPYGLGKSNALHYFVTLFPNSTRNIHIRFILPDIHKTMKEPKIVEGNGKYEFNLKFDTEAFQHQRNPWDWKNAYQKVGSKIKCFVVDEENFKKYLDGSNFECYEYKYEKNGSLSFNATNCYIVFKNDAKRTDIILKLKISVKGNGNFIHIVNQNSNALKIPIVDKKIVRIEGYSTKEGKIKIDNETWNVYGNFSINWNASIGMHKIYVECNDFKKLYKIDVEDLSPPLIKIESPKEREAMKLLNLKGAIKDNDEIKMAKAFIGRNEINLSNKFDLNISLQLGDYILKIVACDRTGNEAKRIINFTISGIEEKPDMKNVYYEPSLPTNESNVIVYADIVKTFYNISKIKIIIDGNEKEMYRYADYPAQKRHNEDALKNESNSPIYGIELGQLNKGLHSFKIEAIDTAGNIAISGEHEIRVS